MPRIIFWNLNKKNLTHLVCSIAAGTDADVVVLLENADSYAETLNALQTRVSQDFYFPSIIDRSRPRFHCFCKVPKLDLSETHSTLRTSVRKLQIGQHTTLLILVHGPDIRNYDHENRREFGYSLAHQMSFLKQEKKTNKLILLGDFNVNPFDRVMNAAAGYNAMMTRACTRLGYRTSLQMKYDFYYNPMWGLFGDNTDGPAGTIYNNSGQGPYGWSMLDQVIFHHSVVDLYEGVRILTRAGEESLMNTKGRPDGANASDHFPIQVDLREDTYE